MRCAGFHRKLGSIHWLIDVLRTWFFDTVNTHYELSEKFKSIISQGGKRIVVVIDDLERLPSDQVCDVVRFIKANGDLPGVVYLVLSDETYLSSAIMKMIPNVKNSHIDSGREYLEKIFPFRLEVPPINPMILQRFVKEHVTEVLDKYGLNDKVKEIDVDNEISDFVVTMRDAKCIVNGFVYELDVAFKEVVNCLVSSFNLNT
jgi:predicted KAP-like P-loop ATPase